MVIEFYFSAEKVKYEMWDHVEDTIFNTFKLKNLEDLIVRWFRNQMAGYISHSPQYIIIAFVDKTLYEIFFNKYIVLFMSFSFANYVQNWRLIIERKKLIALLICQNIHAWKFSFII